MTTNVDVAVSVRQVLRPAPDTVTSPRLVAALLSDPMRPGLSVAERLRYVRLYHASAVDRFGESALIAAAKNVSGCRWCLASALAVRRAEPATRLTSATRVLLGEPCGRCVSRMRNEIGRAHV